MRYFFEPKSVAVIGASSNPGRIGYEILRSVAESGYRGAIYPINPNQTEILNLKVYKEIGKVPEEVDLAVIILSANTVPNAIEQCGQSKVKRVVIISGGFKELGGEGMEMERKAVEAAQRYGIRVIGPNCVGIFNGKKESRLDTFFQPHNTMMRPKEGNVAVLSESGTYGLSLLEWLAEEGMGVSKFVSYGNKCDVSEVDLLSYLGDDPDTKIIAMYMEGPKNGKGFLEIARKVSRAKPIVLLKAGRSAGGALAARSHTGALAGDHRVFSGAATQCGIILADDLEEMFDVVKILSMQPLPQGNGIGMVTNGAGPCVVAVDKIEQSKNLKLAQLSQKSIDILTEKFPPFFVIQNPIDITGSGDAGHYFASLEVLAQDPDVGILLPVFAMQDAPIAYTADEMHSSFLEIKKYNKTFITLAAGGEFTRAQGRRFQENGIPFIPTAGRTISALDKIMGYKRWLED